MQFLLHFHNLKYHTYDHGLPRPLSAPCRILEPYIFWNSHRALIQLTLEGVNGAIGAGVLMTYREGFNRP